MFNRSVGSSGCGRAVRIGWRRAPGIGTGEIIDSTGDGGGNTLDDTRGVAVDLSGNIYVTGYLSVNAFKIGAPGTCSTTGTPCTITEIIDSTGDGGGNTLIGPWGVAVDSSGNVYVAGGDSDNAFKITPCGTITEIIDATGDGNGKVLDGASEVAVDSNGNLYVSGNNSNNAFRIQPVSQVPVLSNGGLALLGASLLCTVFWVARRRRMPNG